jgi:hypothetical protein
MITADGLSTGDPPADDLGKFNAYMKRHPVPYKTTSFASQVISVHGKPWQKWTRQSVNVWAKRYRRPMNSEDQHREREVCFVTP